MARLVSPSSSVMTLIWPLVTLGLALASPASAHDHHGHEGPADDSVPIDSILWMHMSLQAFVWLLLFPLVLVLGLIRHRLHVPLAITSLALTTGGYLLGHGHKGRSFPHTAHGTLASLLIFYLGAQTALGLYLKAHSYKSQSSVRRWLLFAHGVIGKTFPIVGWVQMLFGIITLRSWCFGGHLGQCLAHHIMGSAFIGYAVMLLIMAKAGVNWLKRRQVSQELIDSSVIFVWGLVNSFTEHHGGPWTHKDLQHTLMGVLWVFGGAAGIWLSRGGRRSVFPSIILALTGWAMSGHAQALMISTMIHALFGYALMGAGLARLVEVCFVLHNGPTGVPTSAEEQAESDRRIEQGHKAGEGWFHVKAFQYLPTWLLFASGCLFMSATDEELRWADSQGVDHVTWGLIDFSISFALFFWANVLIDLYTSYGGRYGARRLAERGAVAASGRAESGGVHDHLLRGGDDEDEEDSMEMERMRKERGVASRQSGANGHRLGGGSHSDSSETGTSATHVLFDREDGESDAEDVGKDLDPFDDEDEDERRRRRH